MKRLLLLAALSGCATVPEVDQIGEMWAYAYSHREYDREDSRDVRYVADPEAECGKVNQEAALVVAADRLNGTPLIACTVIGLHNYSILPLHPDALTIGHEAAHRRYGDWHKGFIYFPWRKR